jgi:hypothetical protein
MSIQAPCSSCGRLSPTAGAISTGESAHCPLCNATAILLVDDDAILAEPVTANSQAIRVDCALDATACPKCGAALDAEAVLCIECGFDRRTGRSRTTKIRRFDRYWNTGVPMPGRIAGMIVSALTISITCVVVVVRFELNPAFFMVGVLAVLLVSVVNLGTFSFLRLVRTKKGRLELTRDSYFAYFPLGRRTVDLARYEELRLEARTEGDSDGLGALANFSTLVFLLSLGLLPAAILFVMNAAQVHMKLRMIGRQDRDTLVVYRGTDEDLMREIVEAIQESSNLPLRR